MGSKGIFKYLALSLVIFYALPSLYCAALQFDDPIKIGMGARPLGMGRAFVGVADDTNAIFLNPGGLGSIDHWDLGSMNTSIADTFQYMVLGVVYPYGDATYGFGYVSSMVGQIPYTGGTTGETFDYHNSVMLLSYGRYVGNYLKGLLGKEEEIYAGANLKLFSKGFTGATSETGSGFNFDVGMKYTPSDMDWVTYGMNIQNILPPSLGGGFGGGLEEEEITTLVKLGAAIKVRDDILLAVDDDIYLSKAVPCPLHIGAEWSVNKDLVLRGGIDQSIGSATGGLATNPSLGVGFQLNGFALDISYLMNNGETGSVTNFISFTLRDAAEKAPKEKKKQVEREKPKIVPSLKPVIQKVLMALPKDRQYTYEYKLQIEGSVEPDVAILQFDNRSISINENYAFSDYAPLKIGKNSLKFMIRDITGKDEQFERREVRLFIPQGVSRAELEGKPLDYKIAATLLSDYMENEYRQLEGVTRVRLAVAVSRAGNYKLPVLFNKVSNDVGREYWAARHIQALLDSGALALYKDDTFRPNSYVTRSELLRAISKVTNVPADQLKAYIASDDLNREATMMDLLAVMYNTGMFADGINDYMAFLGMPEVAQPVSQPQQMEPGKSVIVESPQDKLITFSTYVNVAGKVDQSVDNININGETVSIGNGRFLKEKILAVGRNSVVIDAKLNNGNTLTEKRRVLRIALPPDAVFEERARLEARPTEYKVSLLAMSEILGETIQLNGKVTRAKFSKVIYSLKGYNTPKEIMENVASDVPRTHPYAREIKEILKMGALRLDPKGAFEPDADLNRSDLLEAISVIQAVDLAAAAEFFADAKDMSDATTMDDLIQLCWKSGIMQNKLENLLAWESY